jgi:hypothetical protein
VFETVNELSNAIVYVIGFLLYVDVLSVQICLEFVHLVVCFHTNPNTGWHVAL